MQNPIDQTSPLFFYFSFLCRADITEQQLADLEEMNAALNADGGEKRAAAFMALEEMQQEPGEWQDILEAWLNGFYLPQVMRLLTQLREIYPHLRSL